MVLEKSIYSMLLSRYLRPIYDKGIQCRSYTKSSESKPNRKKNRISSFHHHKKSDSIRCDFLFPLPSSKQHIKHKSLVWCFFFWWFSFKEFDCFVVVVVVAVVVEAKFKNITQTLAKLVQESFHQNELYLKKKFKACWNFSLFLLHSKKKKKKQGEQDIYFLLLLHSCCDCLSHDDANRFM